jgi:rhamnosyl/mannosyltransferase
MKVLQVGKFYPHYFSGGIETVSLNIQKGFFNKSIEINFIGFLPKSEKDNVILNNQIFLCKTNIEKFSTQFSISIVKMWLKIRNNYDIILVHMPHPFANVVYFLFPCKKGKLILYWHSDIIKQRKLLYFYKPLLINFIKKASAVIAPTSIHLDKSDFSAFFINKKHIIPYPLDIEIKKYSYMLLKNKKIIFSCGRLIYYKGFDVLIEAAKYLSDNCVIRIAGDGALKETLKKKVNDLKLNDKVTLLGHISDEDLTRELKNSYLFCLPSNCRSEMFGVVQVEAFAFGKPVVSTNIPRSGVPEVNLHNVTGYVVEINNPMALAESINKLLYDTMLYRKFSSNALKRAEYFASRHIVDRVIELFDAINNENTTE